MLSCACDFELGDDHQWQYYIPDNFEILATKRGRRCSSCSVLIKVGSECLKFKRERLPYTDIEENIRGELVLIPPLFMCEKCGEQFLNLEALGYCLDITKNMFDYLFEYHDLTGFFTKSK